MHPNQSSVTMPSSTTLLADNMAGIGWDGDYLPRPPQKRVAHEK